MLDCRTLPSSGTKPMRPVSLLNSKPTKKMISKITPDRSKIVLEHEGHVKYWTRHFGVTKDEFARNRTGW
jgi:hypothetical protein